MCNDTNDLICRLCLNNDNLLLLFDGTTGDGDFSDLLYLTTGVTIEAHDGLPQNICEKCKIDVYSAIYLRNRSQESEVKLLEAGYQKNSKKTVKVDANSDIGGNISQISENCDNISRISEIGDNIISGTVKIGDDIPEINDIEDTFSEIHENYDEISIDNENFEKMTIKNGDVSLESIENGEEISQKTENQIDDINLDDYEIIDGFPELKVHKIKENYDVTKWPIAKALRKVSSREKRQQYLSMVEGKFDPNGPIKCKVCKSIVRNWNSFLSHAKKHIGFDFVCEFCGKSFIGSHQLKRHCRSYHGMKRDIACKHCDYLALDNAQMRLHVRRMHTFERPFVCDECGASYHSRRCLIQHLDCHRPVTISQCKDCPKTFKTSLQLRRHRWRSHKRNVPYTTDLKS